MVTYRYYRLTRDSYGATYRCYRLTHGSYQAACHSCAFILTNEARGQEEKRLRPGSAPGRF